MTGSSFVQPRTRFIEWMRHQLAGPPQRRSDEHDLSGVLPTELLRSAGISFETKHGQA